MSDLQTLVQLLLSAGERSACAAASASDQENVTLTIAAKVRSAPDPVLLYIRFFNIEFPPSWEGVSKLKAARLACGPCPAIAAITAMFLVPPREIAMARLWAQYEKNVGAT